MTKIRSNYDSSNYKNWLIEKQTKLETKKPVFQSWLLVSYPIPLSNLYEYSSHP